MIGGGGVVETPDPMHGRRNVVLTRLQPVHPLSGADFYVVTGEETGDGAHGDWWVRATARCAQPLPGQHMVLDATQLSSSGSQTAQADCPSGERTLGGGAWIVQPTAGHVGLTDLDATSGGAVETAGAHEVGAGYAGDWNIAGWAVCAPTPPGYQIVSVDSPRGSWTETAMATCPWGTQLLGAGGAVTGATQGSVMLAAAANWGGDRTTMAVGMEASSTGVDWGVTAQATCAY